MKTIEQLKARALAIMAEEAEWSLNIVEAESRDAGSTILDDYEENALALIAAQQMVKGLIARLNGTNNRKVN